MKPQMNTVQPSRNQNGFHRRDAENAEVVAGSARFQRAQRF